MGEKQTKPFQLSFNGLLKVDFQGSHVTSDGGLILVRELDERLGLGKLIDEYLSDSRQGLNKKFPLADLLRQSIYSRLAGYEDVNDAVRVSADPTFRLIGSQRNWDRREQPISRIEPLREWLDRPLEQPRFYTGLLSAFAAVAFGLALVGVYGATSYSVTKRRREIGIRMSLGADKTMVERMILKQGLKLTLAAVGIGVAAALGLTRFLGSLLFEVQPHDPLTFLIVCLAVVAVALAACYIPARRATKVDPLVALRYE